jgi:tyrosine-specific transport protein
MEGDRSEGKKCGSVLGGSLLIAGSCIGAATLGLPVITASTGFWPSELMFLLAWAFMCATGLLLFEVNLWFGPNISLVTMAERTLGCIGKWVTWGSFLFLFYILLLALTAGSGNLFVDFLADLCGISIPGNVGGLIFVALFGILVFIGTRAVDWFNRILMAGLIAAYCYLLISGISHVEAERLTHVDWSNSLFVLPVMIISFGYHNLIPSITTYLNCDARRVKRSIILGSLIPFFVYFLWQWLILGLVPYDSPALVNAVDNGQAATAVLRAAVGKGAISLAAEFFAFFALTTTFIGVALSFVDFLFDGFGLERNKRNRALLCILTLIPPYCFAYTYPKIFLIALSLAGGVGAVILFGFIPALMVWAGRYRLEIKGEKMLPGGKFMLMIVIIFAGIIMGLELYKEFGHLIISPETQLNP